MAFPSIRSSATTDGSTATTTPVVNLPATIRAGDTIFVHFRSAVAGAVGWPDATWNELADGSDDAADDQVAIAWRKATGTEGATITLSAGNGKFCAIAIAVRDAADPTLRAPELSTVATGTSAGQPNATTCTPTGGSKDYLWYTVYSMEGEQTGITSYPTNYTLNQTGMTTSGTGGLATTNVTAAGAARQNTAASEDAGAWTVAGTLDDWTAYTVGFHPAVAVDTPLQTEIDRPNPLVKPILTALSAIMVGSALWLQAATPVESVATTQQTTLIQAKKPAPPWEPPNLLATTLAPPAPVAAPFSPIEWVLPKGTPYSVSLRTHLNSLEVQLLGKDQFFGAPGQVVDYDWPLPANTPSSRALTWTQNLQESTLAPAQAVAKPFAQTDWPNPRVSKPVELRSYYDPSEHWLLKDAQFGAPGQAQPLDWPIPSGKPYPRTLTTVVQNLQATTLAPAVGPMPFGQTDWPVAPRKSTLLITTNTREATEAVVVAGTPITPLDFPNPQGKASAIHLRTHTENRKTFYADAVLPPPIAWDVPIAKPSARLLGWTYSLQQSTLAPVVVASPFTPIDLALPIRVRSLVRFESISLLESTLAPAPAQAPFSQTDWRNPLAGNVSPITSRTFLFYYVTDDSVPFLGIADPIPTGKAFARELRTWTQNLTESTLFAPPAPSPFAQTHWPLHRGKSAPITQITWIEPREQFSVDLTPKNQTDWPNPLPIKRLRTLETILQNGQGSALAIPSPLPNNLYDWPNPQGKAFPIALRTWTKARDLGLIEPLPTGRQTEWPNPLPVLRHPELKTWTKGEWLTIYSIIIQIPGQPDVIVTARADIDTIWALEDAGFIVALADPEVDPV